MIIITFIYLFIDLFVKFVKLFCISSSSSILYSVSLLSSFGFVSNHLITVHILIYTSTHAIANLCLLDLGAHSRSSLPVSREDLFSFIQFSALDRSSCIPRAFTLARRNSDNSFPYSDVHSSTANHPICTIELLARGAHCRPLISLSRPDRSTQTSDLRIQGVYHALHHLSYLSQLGTG